MERERRSLPASFAEHGGGTHEVSKGLRGVVVVLHRDSLVDLQVFADLRVCNGDRVDLTVRRHQGANFTDCGVKTVISAHDEIA
jgi:hypothetical protein